MLRQHLRPISKSVTGDPYNAFRRIDDRNPVSPAFRYRQTDEEILQFDVLIHPERLKTISIDSVAQVEIACEQIGSRVSHILVFVIEN